MRIRTIKPEFWSSETVAPLSDKSKLLAIGLLNFADDEGFFWANPVLIRAAVFPFVEDSTTIRRWLDDLSGVGYIRLGKRSDDGREVGEVVNFKIHQRIDRPKLSIIKENVTFDDASSSNRRAIVEQSLLEGKGREGKGTGNRDLGILIPAIVTKTNPPAMAPEQIRLGTFHNRRSGRMFDDAELKAWKKLTPINEEDIKVVEKYYKAVIPIEKDIRRRDLITLLNNWNGEVDRARNFKPVPNLNII